VREHWNKQAEGSKWRFLLVLAFVAGIAAMMGLGNIFPFRTNVFSPDVCEMFLTIELSYMQLFVQCFFKYVGMFAVLLMLFHTGLGKVAFLLCVMWQFFSLGMTMQLLITEYGMWGLGLFIVGCFPQLYIYAAAYMLLYKTGAKISRGIRVTVANYFFVFMVVIIGVVFESYVNPHLVKIFLKIFMEAFYNM